MSTGRMQLSTMLRNERGFSSPWKAPSWPCAKKAAQASLIRSETEVLLEGEESHQMPRHFTECSIGRQVSPMVIPETKAGFLLDVSRAHFSGQRQRPLDFVKESTMAACSVTSSKFVALVRMSSAWAKAPRKRPFTLRPKPLLFKVVSSGSITRLKRVGERTDP